MEITVEEFETLKKNKTPLQLIDVREPYEFELHNLGGILIPIGELPHRIDELDREGQVILYCKSGSRSANAVRWLQQNHRFSNLYSIRGGIVAWAQKMHPSIVETLL